MRYVTVLVLILLGAARAGLAQAAIGSGCFATPEEAARQGTPATSASYGYRLQAARWDSQLARGWAIVASCAHPEWPTVMVPLTQAAAPVARVVSAAAAVPVAPLVRVGDTVQVQYAEELVHLEIAAVAQSSGNLGDVIRVRVNHGALDAGTPEQYVTAVVRGPRSLELRR